MESHNTGDSSSVDSHEFNNNPWDQMEFYARSGGAGVRGPGSELGHPGGPLYVPPPHQPLPQQHQPLPPQHQPPPPQHQPPLPQYLPPPAWSQPAPPPQRVYNVALPPFWPDRVTAWFATVEARFRLNAVQDEQVKFDLVVNALSESSAGPALDVIERPSASCPYTVLKHRLLSAHQLTDYQKISKLLRMEPLGGRRPSELLAAMMDLCPRGEEGNIFFTHLFLERLPAELRIMLGEDDHQDPRPLAEKADKLWAMHGGKFSTIAAVEESPLPQASVAAVAAGPPARGGHRNKRGGAARGRPQATAGATGAAQAVPATNPKALSRLQSGLCFYHWSFGDKALRCEPPCNWGN